MDGETREGLGQLSADTLAQWRAGSRNPVRRLPPFPDGCSLAAKFVRTNLQDTPSLIPYFEYI
ncbi:hypothetical protein CSE45_3002 [Citreicella sp. SE45]|nr:hypothetical protein CSE45_3002 [Citreicella sp. SE45]